MAKQQIVTDERQTVLTEAKCGGCGGTFFARSGQRYCSVRCRRQVDYYRHEEDRRAKRRSRYRNQLQKGGMASKTT